jgi:hypothetical protein
VLAGADRRAVESVAVVERTDGPPAGRHPGQSLVHLASDVWAIIDDFSGAAAASLHCHRSTVLHRLTELNGRSVTEPLAGAELRLALETPGLSWRIVR